MNTKSARTSFNVKNVLIWILWLSIAAIFLCVLFLQRTSGVRHVKSANFPGDCGGPNGTADGYVDLFDYGNLSRSFGLTSGQSGFNAACDFYQDSHNIIDLLDYGVLAQNFGRAGTSITPTPGGRRVVKYFGVDRGNPITDANYSTLSLHAVKTIIIDTDVNGGSTYWQNIINLVSKYNFNFVIWPSDNINTGTRWSNCSSWNDIPYIQNATDKISRVKPMLSYFYNPANWPGGNIKFLGIIIAHEPFWSCRMTVDEMATLKSQLKTYVSATFGKNIEVWNYIDNVAEHARDGLTGNNIERVMDVAVTWQHCFGGQEGTCDNAKSKILADRAAINNAGLDGRVSLLYLFQTFAYGSGYRMPTQTEMHDWSCNFLGSDALDGFMWYTWGACWYDSDLWCPSSTHPNQNLWPVMNQVYDNCTVKN